MLETYPTWEEEDNAAAGPYLKRTALRAIIILHGTLSMILSLPVRQA